MGCNQYCFSSEKLWSHLFSNHNGLEPGKREGGVKMEWNGWEVFQFCSWLLLANLYGRQFVTVYSTRSCINNSLDTEVVMITWLISVKDDLGDHSGHWHILPLEVEENSIPNISPFTNKMFCTLKGTVACVAIKAWEL